MHRRKFLIVIGGASALGLAGGYIWAAPAAKSARASWQNAGQYEDPMLFALSYAILAPNPHNRQPWQIDILNKDEAVLYCDPNRRLPVTDPLNRQITIGLGCFLEVFSLAAQHKSKLPNITLFPNGSDGKWLDHRPVAHIKLGSGKAAYNGLFSQITKRRTDRTPFLDKVPSQSDLGSIQITAGDTAHISNAPKLVDQIRNICQQSTNVEFLSPHIHEESASLMRVGRKAVTKNPDGISIEGPMIELLNLTGAMSPKAMRDQGSTSFKQGLSMYQKAVSTAQSFLWITTPDNTRESQIEAGRAYVRANLMATELGLSMHPLSQSLQEYSEMEDQLANIHEILQIKTPNRIQMLARIGYGQAHTKSPKWPLETRLI